MPFRRQSPAAILRLARNVAVRTGVYAGVGLSVVLVAWIFVSNRTPVLDEFAFERNLVTATLLGLFALIPVLRFLLVPAKLWISSLVGWAIFSVTYALVSAYSAGIPEHFGAFQVFVLGAVIYLILATISWLANIIWRARAARATHPRHSAS